MPRVVSYRRLRNVAVITIDNPPVNAIGHAIRKAVVRALTKLANDPKVEAAVLICAGRTFIAGADISEFDKKLRDPWLPAVVQMFEDSPKPVVAAIHGTALGGGLETAMGCHYRCAVPAARLGMPEVHLGILPGATGTQRLPRLAGVRKALDMMISGAPITAQDAKAHGIIDEIIEGDLQAGAVASARRLVEQKLPLRRVSKLTVDKSGIGPEFFAEYRKQIARQTRGYFAPERIIQCVEAAVQLPYAEGLVRERQLFDECKQSGQSKALRHLFFAEREIAKIPDVPKDTPLRPVKSVGIVGAGTMGGGIAMNFINAGLPVTIVEMNPEGLQRGLTAIRGNYEAAVQRGRMTQQQLEQRMQLLKGSLQYGELAAADVVIEAVFENMNVKKQVFGQLDAVCGPGAILATNTSTLDVNEIAAATRRPQDVIGLHFFAPANVMQLLEVVRGGQTAKDVVATAMALAKTIRKVAVLVGVCFGFAGNRIFFPCVREAQRMVLEGVPPEHVDQVGFEWGLAMGPNAVLDLSGIDVFYKLFSDWKGRPDDPAFCRLVMVLNEMGRLGQKTGAGIYRYEGRNPVPDPEVMKIAKREAKALGIRKRKVKDQEIRDRLLLSMINEGAKVLEEGIALRPGDIDVIFVNGYGFPRYRGGPMFYADSLGLRKVLAGIERQRKRFGDMYWTPAPLLQKLVAERLTFAKWSAGREKQ